MKKLIVKIRRAGYGLVAFFAAKTFEDNFSFSWKNLRSCALWCWGLILKACDFIAKIWEQISPYVLYTAIASIIGIAAYGMYQSFLKLRQLFSTILAMIIIANVIFKVIEMVAVRQRIEANRKS
jgi:hypothetical protein